MFVEELKNNLYKLSSAENSKASPNSFWVILRNIAVKDIKSIYPEKVECLKSGSTLRV